jgi:hypothetical protein
LDQIDRVRPYLRVLKQEVLRRSNPLIWHGLHRKRCFQQFFAAAVTWLPSRCLATIRGYTDRPTDSHLLGHGPHRKRRGQQLFYCCVCIPCRGNVFIELLPSNDTHADTDWWEGFMKYTVEMGSGTMIYIPTFMHSDIQKLIRGDSQTHIDRMVISSAFFIFSK